MAVSFGCTTGTCTYGTINITGTNDTAEIAQCRDAAGLITDEKAYSRTLKSHVTAVLTGTVPNVGATNTIFANTGILESVNVSETNTGYAMIEATVTKTDSATQAFLAAPTA
jgi:hypothetical protein